MMDGRLNVGRLEGKFVLRLVSGKNAASRRKMRRTVSKARRRIARIAVRAEQWLELEEHYREAMA